MMQPPEHLRNGRRHKNQGEAKQWPVERGRQNVSQNLDALAGRPERVGHKNIERESNAKKV